MTKKRMHPEARRDQLLIAAIGAARQHGYDRMTRDQVAAAAGVSTGCVNKYFGTMLQLRRAVMRAAISARDPVVVGQGLVARDPHALRTDDALKAQAREALF